MLLVVCLNLMTGCNTRLTPKRLMDTVTNNLTEAKSATTSLYMKAEFEDVLDLMKISMDMQMENTTKPKAGHAKGKALVDVSGTKVESDIEIYQIMEGQEFATYSSIYGQWSREVTKGNQQSGFNGNLLQGAEKSIRSFRIAEEKVIVGGKKCYEMYGDISGKEFLDFMGLDIVKVFGLVELPGEDTIKQLEIPITVDIYEAELLPARVFVDMTDVMNELYKKHGKSTSVNDFTIKLEYMGFNQKEKIEVPLEIRQALGK